MAIAAVALVLAVGNLMSLPSIERQLVRALPLAAAGVEDAAAQSRRKSYYGIAVGAALGLAGGVLVLTAARGRGTERGPIDTSRFRRLSDD